MKNTKFIQTLAGLILAACTGSSLDLQANEAPQFEVTVLISTNATKLYEGSLVALNNKGESVGTWWDNDIQAIQGVLIYPNATVVKLPNLMPELCPGGPMINNINDKTQIVGACNGTAMVYTLSGGLVNLGGLGGGGSIAYAINDAGQIVGSANIEEGINTTQHAVVFFENGTIIDLGALDNGWSAAYDINDNYGPDGLGQVVGVSNEEVFLFENAFMANIGQVVCGNQSSYASKINNKGTTAGYCGAYTSPNVAVSGFICGSRQYEYAIFMQPH